MNQLILEVDETYQLQSFRTTLEPLHLEERLALIHCFRQHDVGSGTPI